MLFIKTTPAQVEALKKQAKRIQRNGGGKPPTYPTESCPQGRQIVASSGATVLPCAIP